MKKFCLCCFWVLSICLFAEKTNVDISKEEIILVDSKEVFNSKTAVVLGVVEGLTEYLPVSSTGHLIITNELLNLDKDTPLLTREVPKKIILDKKGNAFTLKNAADAYSIVIQFGAILAVVFAYWGRVSGTIIGVLRRDRKSFIMTRNLIVAFVPAAGLGFLFHEYIEFYLFNSLTVSIALIVGGIFMLIVDRRQKKAAKKEGESKLDLDEMNTKQSLTIGLMQCLALCPGMSRSMATIVGGYIAGLSPTRATEFSFLLGLITLSAASFYKGFKSGDTMLQAFGFAPSLIGLIVAFFAAFISVKWLVSWISKNGISAFAWYRFALAAVILFFF